MKQFPAHVHSNESIASGYFKMWFDWHPEAPQPLPGQFLTVKSFGTTDLILRRPFALSSFDAKRNRAAMIYQQKGPATSMLAGKRPGETIDLIAPLGNRFPPPEGRRAILVGGGVGLGPILFFGNALAAEEAKPTVVLGFREISLVPALLSDRSRIRFEPIVCTDDGSVGFSGTTVDWLNAQAAARSGPFDGLDEGTRGAVLYVCGPNPMMAACDDLARRHGMACWASMEQIMGCGVGACMGCAIPIRGEGSFARVCTEGPVFESGGIEWEQLR